MSSINLYKSDGTITLPNGSSIHDNITLDYFKSAIEFAGAKQQSNGTPPWVYLRFLPGYVDDHELIATICFYEQLLVSVSLTINLYKTGKPDGAAVSAETELETKSLHERLLKKLLGSPTRYGGTNAAAPTDDSERLNCPSYWDFHWGEISSHHDAESGGTFITIEYGDRRNISNQAHENRAP